MTAVSTAWPLLAPGRSDPDSPACRDQIEGCSCIRNARARIPPNGGAAFLPRRNRSCRVSVDARGRLTGAGGMGSRETFAGQSVAIASMLRMSWTLIWRTCFALLSEKRKAARTRSSRRVGCFRFLRAYAQSMQLATHRQGAVVGGRNAPEAITGTSTALAISSAPARFGPAQHAVGFRCRCR